MNKLKACNKVNKLHELEKRIKAMILFYGTQKTIRKLQQMSRQRLIYLSEIEDKLLVVKDRDIYDYTGDDLQFYIPNNDKALEIYNSIKFLIATKKNLSQ